MFKNIRFPTYLLLVLIGVTATACTLGVPNLQKKDEPITTDQQDATKEEEPAQEGSAVKSLKDLFSMQTAQKCSMKQTTDDEYTGTIYISGKKFYQETNTKEGTVYAISDGQTVYSWSTMSASGIKMDVNLEDLVNNPSSDDTKLSDMNLDPEKIADLKCSPWVVDASKFEAPSSIQFMDVSELLKNFDMDKLKEMDLPN